MSRGSHRTFHHHLEVDSSASVAPSESSESQSGAGSPFKSRIAPKARVFHPLFKFSQGFFM